MEIIFRIHATQRMFERDVSGIEIREVLENGERIEDYPEDTPYPSRLMLGWIGGTRPLHVVVADNFDENEWIVITVYEPNLNRWEADYKRRK